MMEIPKPTKFRMVHATNPNHLYPRNLLKDEIFEAYNPFTQEWVELIASVNAYEITSDYPYIKKGFIFPKGDWVVQCENIVLKWDLKYRHWVFPYDLRR